MPVGFTFGKLRRPLLGLGFLVLALQVAAIPRYSLRDVPTDQAIGRHFEFLPDPSGELDFNAVRNTQSTRWRSIYRENPSFGFTQVPHWFRSEVFNARDRALDLRLKIKAPNLNALEIFVINASGEYQHFVMGDRLPFNQRPIRDPNFVLPVSIAASETKTFYIKAQTQGTLALPIYLLTADDFVNNQQTFFVFQGVFFGLMFTMAFYNFCLFFGIRSREYLYYSLAIFGGTVFLLGYSGLGFQFLWPYYPGLNMYVIPLSLSLFYLGVVLLAGNILKVRQYASHLNPYLSSFIIGIGIIGGLSLILPYSQAIVLVTFFGFSIGIGILALSLYLYARGDRRLKYFILSWVAFTVGVILLLTSASGISGRGFWNNYAIEVASTLIIIWTSASLSSRFNRERREKMRAQHRSLRHQRKANKEQDRYLKLRLTAQTEELHSRKRVIEAEASNRAKSDFLANISHEIRTPMNGILGVTQLLEDSNLNSQQKHYVNIINNSCRILLRLINDLLDFSKISAGKLSLESIALDINQLCRECVATYENMAIKNAVKLELELRIANHFYIRGDPTRLRQVINNLLDNAFKFTRQGSVKLAVTEQKGDTSAQAKDQSLLLFEIQDTGIGIDEESLPRLFDSFTQANTSTTREFGGTGLGLSICKQIIELMGGKIGVTSALGKGSTFWFTLPYHRTDEKPIDAIQPTPPVTTVDAPAVRETVLEPGLTVLVAEDNPVNQIVIAGLLKKLQLNFVLCASGSEVIEKFQQAPDAYSSILMDCEMPGMDGFEATRRVRRFESQQNLEPIPIIAVTAHSYSEYKERLNSAGFSDHLAKPIDLSSLKEKLASINHCADIV